MSKQHKLKRGKSELISTAGNYLCGLFLSDLARRVLPDFLTARRRSDAINDRDILLTQVALVCNARTDFNDVDLYRDDSVFTHSYGINRLPSEAVLRKRLDEMPRDYTHAAIRKLNLELLGSRDFGRVDADGLELVPVDMDVSPFDNSGSSKEGVSYTYKKHHGYAPMFSYIGTEGYMLDCELRPGKQHCQSGTPQAIARTVGMIDKLGLGGKCLFRLDSGNDSADNFAEFGDNRYIVKRNLRRESREQWLGLARRVGDKLDSRPGKNVYVGFVDHRRPGGKESTPCVPVAFEVIERLEDHDGNLLLVPDIEVNTWWTNLPCRAQTVIGLYHAHGTSEQFHSELKSDLDVERLSSSKICVNRIILLCSMVSFNLLRILGQETIKRSHLAPQKIKVARWRIKTVLQNLIYCAARVVRHAGRVELHFGKRCPWFDVFEDIAAATA